MPTPDTTRSSLDVHASLMQLAQAAVGQVAANPRPADALLPTESQQVQPSASVPSR